MTTLNKYDTFIESLTKQFSTIPNFQLTQEDGPGKTLFNSIVKRIAELNSLKTLYINYYIPTALKATDDDIIEISKSKYKSLIPLTDKDLKENYYETVRLGYVAAYHKYEIFIKELITNSENIFSELNDKNVLLDKYIEKTFGFKIFDVSYSPTLHRINYLCNCTKHYDGYPRKATKPKYFETFPEDTKIDFTEKELSADIDFLISHFNILIQTILFLSSHKMIHEGLLTDLDEIEEGPDKEKILKQKKIFDNGAKQLIDSLKLI